ncbi:uncharacterized protein C8A04DRAFT_39295 [Dichotomopilus funicola]|uniref:Rhodopsin domain-containing protein n=1 Tax=Dichotomopilus funicola TaxID=1934379 RepID=A0AAN6UY42_9PEZI|nr:hypothetical protein C8A04DRAFT_39295 [Dichotomopilus funicola]
MAAAADLSRGSVLLSLSLATAGFALVTTFVRFYARRGIDGGLRGDDYVSGVATVIALLATIFGVLEGTAPDGPRAMMFNVIGQPWYLVSVTLSKISICLFFMALLKRARARQWQVLLAGLIILMAATNLALALAVYLRCQPLAKVWDGAVVGSCADPAIQTGFGYAQGAFSVFSWVFLALFSMLIIRDLARGRQAAWPFYATSVLGFISGVFVIVRTAQTSQTTDTSIYTVHFFYASLMANLEQNLALTTSNILTLGPLFSPTTTSSSTTSSSTTTVHSQDRRKRRRRRNRNPYGSSSSRRSGKSAAVLGSHTSNSSGALSDMGSSTRAITQADERENGRASSRGSSRGDESSPYPRRDDDKDEMAGGNGVGEIERKRTTHLIIEGPGYRSNNSKNNNDPDHIPGHDLADGRRIPAPPFHTTSSGYASDDRRDLERGYNSLSDSDSQDGSEDDGDYDEGSEIDLDLELSAWPRGIIKTVSVEVVEEVNEEYVAAVAAAAAHARSISNTGGITQNNPDGKNPGSRGSGGTTGVGNSTKGIGRNSVTIAPRVVGAGGGGDRLSGGSGMEQDWEAMLRAGPPR